MASPVIVEQWGRFWNQSEVFLLTSSTPFTLYTGKNVDYFVTGVGTGGTATGVGKYLVEKNPKCKVICVEPTESRVHLGAAHSPHTILGIGAKAIWSAS